MRVRYLTCSLWILALSAMAIGVHACAPKGSSATPGAKIAPAPGDGHDGGVSVYHPTQRPASNGRCYVCHINYEEEELATLHAKAGVGCEKCHGASDAHCSDEEGLTAPRYMYAPAKVNGSCLKCHPRDRIDIKPHASLFDAAKPSGKLCTDCHGKHRLSKRTRNWDKATGKLIKGK
ncbi:MAG: hypothetical protein JXQ73_05095 [Phycisphaerae bacterium]|nr:hypothetical protein [Phycisphaerae bacterium]